MSYLKLPLLFEPFFERQSLATCDMEGSIMRFLHLVLTTVQEEYLIDEQFGLAFWDDDFSTHVSIDFRKEQMIQHIKMQIRQYEPRLTNVQVQVNVRNERIQQPGMPGERRRVEISILGALTHSAAPFQFHTAFFIGPLDLS